jgi:Ser/Thr protein kinase RdoA (MazF antagonist)
VTSLLESFAALPPWLVDITDGRRVAAALEATLPEAKSGALDIVGCEAVRLRLEDGLWAGSYDITMRTGVDAVPRVVRLQGATIAPGASPPAPVPGARFGSEQWRIYLPELALALEPQPPDVDLPALPLLTDPDRARELLERSIRATGGPYEDFRLHSCAPQVMRYKPGSRCTIRYRLEYPDEMAGRGWPEIVVAKTYRGDKGQVAWEGMRALWHSPMASSGVAIAEPLAYLPEPRVLVQGPIREEQTLKRSIRRVLDGEAQAGRAELRRQVRATAAGLAVLHGCGVRHGELVTWEDEREEVRGVIARIAARVPELEGAAEPLLAELTSIAERNAADPAGPAHRSFRPAQVLLAGDSLGFIDFDGFCQAEPALDVALFRTSVRQLGSGPAHDEILDQLAAEFLDEYSKQVPVSRVRVALWEALDLLTRVLHCWTKVKPERASEAMSALERHLASEPLGLSV